jgi:hypothetical protein
MTLFDYTDEEWAKILVAIRRVSGSISDHKRRRLRSNAHLFRHEMSTGFLKKRNETFAQRWLKVVKLTTELTDVLAAESNASAWLPPELKRYIASVDKLRRYAAERTATDALYKFLKGRLSEGDLQEFCHLSGAYSPYEPPLQKFYQATLDAWVDLFGGRLATSSNAKTEYSGPAIDFFAAVVNPARMAVNNPERKSIRRPLTRATIDGIIKDGKKRRHASEIDS